MAQPFDFTTPITENTTLVARYRCGSAPYAGEWFRFTMADGKQYVPQSISEAESTASSCAIGQTSAPAISLTNTQTGIVETINPNNIERIEFGGGWRAANIYRFFELGNGSGSTASSLSLRYITGYPQGLSLTSTNGMFFATGVSVAFHSKLNIDMTGFKFDYNLWQNGMCRSYSNYKALIVYSSSSSSGTGGGVFGEVEPLFESGTTYSNAFAGDSQSSLSYTKGFGFAGQYAQKWLEKYPTSSSYPYRTTYLA